MLVTLKEISQKAMAEKYAVGAFNTVNLDSIRAVLDAAEGLGQPVILQHAQLH
ncbi:class II fructose-bisphosphate aldolase, partial [Eubacterium aggregans]